MNIKKRNQGFSLVELLVVITIIAILSVTAFLALGGQTAKARNSVRQQDLTSLQSAIEIYYINNNNTYPPDLNALLTAKLITSIPTDPSAKDASNNPIQYSYEDQPATKTYQLGATLEDEANPFGKSYIIGNAITDLFTNGVTPNYGGCTVTNNSTACVPYPFSPAPAPPAPPAP